MEKIKIIKALKFHIVIEFMGKQLVVFPNYFFELKSNNIESKLSMLWPVTSYKDVINEGFYSDAEKSFYRIVGIFVLDESEEDLDRKKVYYGVRTFYCK